MISYEPRGPDLFVNGERLSAAAFVSSTPEHQVAVLSGRGLTVDQAVLFVELLRSEHRIEKAVAVFKYMQERQG